MEKQFIIAISREFGSRGHKIAEIIANDLGFDLYDRSILDNIAIEKNIKIEYLEKYDEKPRKVVCSRKVGNFSNSIEEVMAEIQFDYLREKASEGKSFVVVGRCGETVFKDHPGLISIFVTGDYDVKLACVMEKFNLGKKEAAFKMSRHDYNRKKYHNYHSDFKWGDSRHYDMCINGSKLGEEKTAQVLEQYIKERMSE